MFCKSGDNIFNFRVQFKKYFFKTIKGLWYCSTNYHKVSRFRHLGHFKLDNFLYLWNSKLDLLVIVTLANVNFCFDIPGTFKALQLTNLFLHNACTIYMFSFFTSVILHSNLCLFLRSFLWTSELLIIDWLLFLFIINNMAIIKSSDSQLNMRKRKCSPKWGSNILFQMDYSL